jgi:antitoxin component YwqK of YwqJK toxin-antitoxin module
MQISVFVRCVIVFTLLLSSFNTYAYDKNLAKSGELLSAAYEKLKDKDTTGALELYALVNQNDTNYAIALVNRIVLHKELKNYEKCLELSNLGLIDPGKHEWTFISHKGNAYLNLERYDDALNTYLEGTKKYPFNHILHYNTAIAYKEKKMYEEYVTYLEKTVELYPFYATVHFELGSLAYREKHTSQALMSYIMGILLDPRSERSQLALAVIHNMVTDKFETEELEDYDFPEGKDDYSEIDNIISNYVALQKGYKVQSKADIPLIRQIQVLFETVQYDKSDEGFWMQFYVNFYKKLWNEKQFESFSYYLLRPSGVAEHQRLVSKKSKQITLFSNWAGKSIREYFSGLPLEIDGKVVVALRSYNSDVDGLSAVGDIKNGLRVGCWYYIHESGVIRAKGCYGVGGKMTGEWKWYDEQGNIQHHFTALNGEYEGMYKNYYRIGPLHEETEYVKGKRHGVYKEYHKLGGLYREFSYTDGVANGPGKIYHPNGAVKYDYHQKEGKLDGLLRQYYANGQLKQLTNYIAGEMDSISTAYYTNGQVENRYAYKNGTLEGPFERYFMDGTLKEKGQYTAGKIIEYYGNGQVMEQHIYDEEGKQNGLAQYFDYDGILYEEFDFKKGNIVGYRIFNKKGDVVSQGVRKGGDFMYNSLKPDGTKGSEGLYDSKGGRQGEWKYYDKNGALSEVSTYKDGSREGLRTEYHPSGIVRSKTEYEKGNWEGYFERYYTSGVMQEEGYGIKGDLEGPYFEYAANGDTIENLFYIHDDLHGWQEYVGLNGKMERKVLYDYGDLIAEVFIDTNGVVHDTLNYIGHTGKGTVKYPHGTLYYEAALMNGQRNGITSWYYGNGQLSQQGNYVNGSANGEFIKYFPDGTVSSRYSYVMGTRHGKVTNYHENGKPQETYSYNYGILEGPDSLFSDDGVLISTYTYELGKINGKRMFFDLSGKLDHIRYYFYGKILGYSYLGKDGKEVEMIPITNETQEVKSYFDNGKLSRSYILDKGDFQGEYKEFYYSGQLSEVSIYKNDLQEGERTYYYEDGSVKRRQNRLHGKYHGTDIEYYKNGKIKVERHYLVGEKHGTWKYYNSSGKLTRTEHYYLNFLFASE